MVQTGRAVMALILREMATSYGRSPGGYAWAVLEPLAGIALLTVVLSVAFHAPPLGSSFALFYIFGLSMVLIVFGLIFLRRYHRNLIEAA